MKKNNFLFLFLFFLAGCTTTFDHDKNVEKFVQRVAVRDNFDPQQLTNLFSQVKPDKRVIRSMKKPGESLPWYRYRPIFITDSRIADGVVFWRNHAAVLNQVQQQYGVPPEMIVSILGIETRYGTKQGAFSVFRSLSTLAFDYPPRAAYFQSELEQFLLLSRDIPLDPLSVYGSYAGASGAPQFMPSSYRHYAVSYDGQHYSNLFSNPDDAIVSIANYFKEHGWQPGGLVAVPVRVVGQDYVSLLSQHKPTLTVEALSHYGVYLPRDIDKTALAYLIKLDGETGPEYWLAFNNFYVITRYNTSPLYAMAAFQLSQKIKHDYR